MTGRPPTAYMASRLVHLDGTRGSYLHVGSVLGPHTGGGQFIVDLQHRTSAAVLGEPAGDDRPRCRRGQGASQSARLLTGWYGPASQSRSPPISVQVDPVPNRAADVVRHFEGHDGAEPLVLRLTRVAVPVVDALKQQMHVHR